MVPNLANQSILANRFQPYSVAQSPASRPQVGVYTEADTSRTIDRVFQKGQQFSQRRRYYNCHSVIVQQMTAPTNIVWLTLESTRYDHTTMSGYERDTTPRLAEIADRPHGRCFPHGISHGIYTRPSSASILTGSPPAYHGAGMDHDTIPDSLPTFPKRLQRAGYDTACFSMNPHLLEATGLDRGFSDFRWIGTDTIHEVAGIYNLFKFLVKLPVYGGGYTRQYEKHPLSYLVTKGIKRNLEDGGSPQFVYAHLGDPHHPYCPPEYLLDEYLDQHDLDGDEARKIPLDMSENLMEYISRGCDFSSREWAAITAMYDSCVRFVDSCVGAVFDYLQRLDDDFVLVVTGDHGELFGEQDMLAHKLLIDDAVTHIPVVVCGNTPVTEYDGELVQPIDIVRTICEQVGVDTDSLFGRDLSEEERTVAVTQRGWPRAKLNIEKLDEESEDFDETSYRTGRVTALRDTEYKYVTSDDGPELFRLPNERTDVSEEHPSKIEEFERYHSEFIDRTSREDLTSDRSSEMNDDMRQQLEDLGYITE